MGIEPMSEAWEASDNRNYYHSILIHYGKSAREAESLVSEIQTKGGRANAISADLGIPDGAALLAKQVRSIVGDRLDVLVLNAGISKAARIADYTVEDFDNLFATNVRSPFFLVQQLLPIRSEGSTIIAVSSIGAHAVVGKLSLDSLCVSLWLANCYFATATGHVNIVTCLVLINLPPISFELHVADS